MKYLKLYEDFVRNEEPGEQAEPVKKPVKVKVDEADQEEDPKGKPSPQQFKKKKAALPEDEEIEEDDECQFDEENDEEEPEIIREFKAHLKKIDKRR